MQVTRYHPPAVRAAITELSVAKERLAATASASWLDFLRSDFGTHHYGQLKVGSLHSCRQVCEREKQVISLKAMLSSVCAQ